MMAPKPRAQWDDFERWSPPITIYETPPEAIDTGLLDASGTKIFRHTEISPIGFDLSRKKGRA